MTDEEIIKMATKVYGECDWHESALHHLEAFAKLVAEKEREECAKICDDMDSISDYYTLRVELICAQAIRARGQ
jgi:hypothetical protein